VDKAAEVFQKHMLCPSTACLGDIESELVVLLNEMHWAAAHLLVHKWHWLPHQPLGIAFADTLQVILASNACGSEQAFDALP